jgi:hypothetical protein
MKMTNMGNGEKNGFNAEVWGKRNIRGEEKVKMTRMESGISNPY